MIFLLQFVNQNDDFVLDSLSSKERYDFDMKRSMAMARDQYNKTDFAITQLLQNYGYILMHDFSLYLQLCTTNNLKLSLCLPDVNM